MPLTKYEVKERLGHGAVSEIAADCGRSIAHVSRVLNGKRPDRVVARRVAQRLRVRIADLPAEYVTAQVAA